jgi:hypothetical protein
LTFCICLITINIVVNTIKIIHKTINLREGAIFMADYQDMYAVLFRKVTDVIEELKNVQRQTEERYLSSEQSDIRMIHGNEKEKSEK